MAIATLVVLVQLVSANTTSGGTLCNMSTSVALVTRGEVRIVEGGEVFVGRLSNAAADVCAAGEAILGTSSGASAGVDGLPIDGLGDVVITSNFGTGSGAERALLNGSVPSSQAGAHIVIAIIIGSCAGLTSTSAVSCSRCILVSSQPSVITVACSALVVTIASPARLAERRLLRVVTEPSGINVRGVVQWLLI